MTNPAAPTRATSSCTLMLGLVPIPIRLFTPTQDIETVKRYMVTPAGNRVVSPYLDAETREEVPKSECRFMVKVGDKEVELTDDEKAEVTAGAAVDRGQVPIESFIPLTALNDRYRTYKWYQARPQQREVGKRKEDDPVANKAFMLLLSALEEKGLAALVRVGLRSAARYAALTPDGNFHYLHFDSEVRQERELPDAEVSSAERAMAIQIIDEIGVDTPDLVDDEARLLTEYLEQKAAGKVKPKAKPVESKVADVDLTALLSASVAKPKTRKKAAA